jgi:hypothetical protein
MKFKFQFIGHPFSLEKPGVTLEFEEWDVPDMRRASNEWREVSDTTHMIVEPKFIKIRGRPKAVFQQSGVDDGDV